MAVGAAIGGSVLSARSNRKASKRASDAQIAAAEIAADESRQAREEASARLQPFEEFGLSVIPRAQQLFGDPSEAILNNPLFTALADDTQRRLFANRAARGKLGSGGTAEALQNALLRTGLGLISQERADILNAIGVGQNAAARTGVNALNTAANIGDLQTQAGDARAAGKIGRANALTDGIDNITGILALSGAFD